MWPSCCPRDSPPLTTLVSRPGRALLFAQEFEGEFIDAESSAFSAEMIELALVDDFERFIQ